jgi:ATP-binding protein involved in chromosome partitioning
MLDRDSVEKALMSVKDISGGSDIVSMKRVEKITIDGNSVMLTLELPTEDAEIKRRIEDESREAVKTIDGVAGVMIMTKGIQPQTGARGRSTPQTHSLSDEQKPIEGVKNIIAVSSAKGGVGKSTVCVNIALALQKSGAKVGILDADVYGPSIHLLLDVMERPQPGKNKEIAPVVKNDLKLMSLGFLADKTNPVMWRGPLVTSVVKKFLEDVDWAPLDYLLIDMPPGTGDAQLTLVQTVPLTGAIIITTPSELALVDAEKGLQMFRVVEVPVLGIVENMSHFVCPHCSEKTEIFGSGGGLAISDRLQTEFLGEIPLDVQVRTDGDRGRPIMTTDVDSPATRAFIEVAASITEVCPASV